MNSYEDLVITARTESLDRNRRHAAFGSLVKQFQRLAYRCACKLLNDPRLAEDITQEAFITAYQKLHQLRDPGAFPGWLCQITRTQCHRWQRRSRLTVTDIERVDTAFIESPGPEVKIEQRDLTGRVNASRRVLIVGVMPVGALIGGLLGESIGWRGTLFVGGAVLLRSTLFHLRSPLRQTISY
jgi:predicted RNA polymerase sigma factor